ncbi:MAG: DNA mismatch repair protein MutS [Firmicutes bacterium]|nr:DNA mismatch repair protein MutS [Bacillota bacterium]
MKFLDKDTKSIIGFDYVLENIEVATPFGKEYKSKLKPFMPGEEKLLKKEFERIEKILRLIDEDKLTFLKLNTLFTEIKDLRKSLKRTVNGDTLTVVELFEMKTFILLLRKINEKITSLNWEVPKRLKVEPINELEKLFDPKNRGIKTFYIYDEYSQTLKEIRDDKRKLSKDIKRENKKIKEKIRKDLKLNVKPNGEVIIPKDEKNFIEMVDNYSLLQYSSETYMNKKYIIKPTELIRILTKQLEKLKEMEEEEEYKVRTFLSKKIASFNESILKNMKAIGNLDLTIAKAYLALDIDGIKPDIINDKKLKIKEGRHIEVEDALKESGRDFVAIDLDIENGVTCITGANMGGKTVSLKLVALNASMAQYGLYVPCKYMSTGLFDFLSVSIGDYQSTDMGLSTFGGEIKKVQRAMKRSNEYGLILIDELANGTNPQEGSAISMAIVNFLKKKPSMSVITTHYDNVSTIPGIKHLQVVGLENVDYESLEEKLKKESDYGMEMIAKYMDYRLKEVHNLGQVPRDAINIAKLMGLDEEILEDAEKMLENFYINELSLAGSEN